MKFAYSTLFTSLFFTCIALCGPACAGTSAGKSVPLDLSPAGEEWNGIIMTVPEGAKLSAEVISIVVNKGDKFRISLSAGDVDLSERKKEIKENSVNKLKNFAVERPDALLYSSDTGMGEEWHFAAVVKVGGASFFCEDDKGPVYSRSEAEAMLKSAQTLRKK